MANQPAQTLKGIGKDVPPHIANPVTADAGKHEESYPQAAPRLTQSPWPLWWQSQAGQPLGVTQQTIYAITGLGPFPIPWQISTSYWEVSWSETSLSGGHRGFLVRGAGCGFQRQPWAWMCATAAARGCVGRNTMSCSAFAAGSSRAPALTVALLALHSHPCLPQINQLCSWHPWAAALNRKAICSFLFPHKKLHQCGVA